jgi:decaprenylphospho-beta-D-erythro-pentofuranosid-2-ulose 2-reductase
MGWLLVLGAKSDIGKAVAHKFAQNGFDIMLAARDNRDLENDIKDLKIRFGIRAIALQFDALDTGSHNNLLKDLPDRPSGVVCVVGYLGDQKIAELDFKEARRIIDTNYTGCVSALNVIANDFELRNEGFIIGISSAAGERGRQSNYIYGSAKAAFTAYLSGLRNRLSKTKVHVMTVKPGFVKTKMTEKMDLPPLLTAQPDEVAGDIYKAWKNGRDVIYTKWFWRYIMMIIRNIPERIFKKLNL